MIKVELPKQLRRHAPVSAPPNELVLFRLRRRTRRRWFPLAEILSLAVMVGSVVAGISERFAAESLTALFRILPVAAAIVAGILPILLFGNPNRPSRRRRQASGKSPAVAAAPAGSNKLVIRRW
jgi:hypothetical protein